MFERVHVKPFHNTNACSDYIIGQKVLFLLLVRDLCALHFSSECYVTCILSNSMYSDTRLTITSLAHQATFQILASIIAVILRFYNLYSIKAFYPKALSR